MKKCGERISRAESEFIANALCKRKSNGERKRERKKEKKRKKTR